MSTFTDDDLTCPVCMNYQIAPIYMCNNKHSVCNKCIFQVDTCPMCRIELDHSNLRRNTDMEREIAQRLLPCPDCEIEVRGSDMELHAKKCDGVLVKCPLRFQGLCKSVLKYKQIAKHLDDDHDFFFVEPNSVEFSINNKNEYNQGYYFEKMNEKLLVVLSVKKTSRENTVITVMPIILTSDTNRGQSNFSLEIVINEEFTPSVNTITLPFYWQNAYPVRMSNSIILNNFQKGNKKEQKVSLLMTVMHGSEKLKSDK